MRLSDFGEGGFSVALEFSSSVFFCMSCFGTPNNCLREGVGGYWGLSTYGFILTLNGLFIY